MKNLSIAIITVLSFSAVSAKAQENNPLNFMNQQLSEQLLNQVIALSDPKLIKAQAELLRKHYQALIVSGFSKDEAMQLVVALASQNKCD